MEEGVSHCRDPHRVLRQNRGREQDVQEDRPGSDLDGVAAQVAFDHREDMTLIRGGRAFYKMTGSGNDFIFFDARSVPPQRFESTSAIQSLCARGTGIGADGVVFLIDHPEADIGLRYYNADGSLASLCGNATLCTANLAVLIDAVEPAAFKIFTDAGVVAARVRDGLPEFDFPPVTDVQSDYRLVPRAPGELRLGYATAGVPHVVIQVEELAEVDVIGRGGHVRNDPSFPHGTNVNFVARDKIHGWSIRTFERGVEDETLACGTGNVAAAILLRSWDEGGDSAAGINLLTRSGQTLRVRLSEDQGGVWHPSLSGEGRLVFIGEVAI